MEEMVASIEQGATLANVAGAALKTTGNVARGLGEKISNEVTRLINNIRSALSNMIKEGEQQIMRAAINP